MYLNVSDSSDIRHNDTDGAHLPSSVPNAYFLKKNAQEKRHTKFRIPSSKFLSSAQLITRVMKLSLPQSTVAAGCTRCYIVPQERIRFLLNAQIYDQTSNWNPIEQVLILIKISSLASPDPVPFRTLIGSRYNNRSVSLCRCYRTRSCTCTSASDRLRATPAPN